MLLILFCNFLFSCTSLKESIDSTSASIIKAEVIIGNVNVIPMTEGAGIVRNQYIEITNGKISHISSKCSNQSSIYIDGTGKYIIPGLTEMHAHIPIPKEGDDVLVHETLFLYLSQGITTIRGMLGDPYHLQLKKEIKAGNILSPRVYTSSPSLNGNSVKSVEEAGKKVLQYAKEGYDFLKIHPGIRIENWNEIEKKANENDLPYAGHIPYEVGIDRAITAKFATIDHLDGFIEGLVPNNSYKDSERGFFGYNLIDRVDRGGINDLVRRIVDHNIAVVPTQTLFTRWFSPEPAEEMMAADEMKYMPSQTRFAWRQNKSRMIGDSSYSVSNWESMISLRHEILQELYKQGATILLGSDAPQVMNVPGFSLHHEMKSMVAAGIPIIDVLKAGTSTPAKFFNNERSYGSIEIGASADILLLTENPLENIDNMQKIEQVFVRGIQLTRRDINTQLKLIALRNR
ncbi:MAG: imidazolonepropionase-like amidohydrolase [Saprospiraceae bacterium]|jgi:imidazolonepropionase-like amidohydrolase